MNKIPYGDSYPEMHIVIDPHTLAKAEERGTTELEMMDVIRTGEIGTAKYGRLRKSKTYEFKRLWRSRYYEQKRVEVVYAVEGNVVTTVTVYVFYGKW